MRLIFTLLIAFFAATSMAMALDKPPLIGAGQWYENQVCSSPLITKSGLCVFPDTEIGFQKKTLTIVVVEIDPQTGDVTQTGGTQTESVATTKLIQAKNVCAEYTKRNWEFIYDRQQGMDIQSCNDLEVGDWVYYWAPKDFLLPLFVVE